MQTYDHDTAKAIIDVAMTITNKRVCKEDMGHQLEFFRYEEKGIWPANQFDPESIEGRMLEWKPCHELDRASGLNRRTTPGLPFQFTCRQLAAFMMRGVGALIADAFGDWEEGPAADRLARLKEDWDRSAIEGAYAAYRAAECAVGPFDNTLARMAQELDDAFWNADVSQRTTEQREALRIAYKNADDAESAWRKKMVNQLLAVELVPADEGIGGAVSAANKVKNDVSANAGEQQSSEANAPQRVELVPPGPTVEPAGEWVTQAQTRAREIVKESRERDRYPSQKNIGDTIAAEFRKAGIVGSDGKPLSGATIKRHALKGISSASGKQLSTTIGWGK